MGRTRWKHHASNSSKRKGERRREKWREKEAAKRAATMAARVLLAPTPTELFQYYVPWQVSQTAYHSGYSGSIWSVIEFSTSIAYSARNCSYIGDERREKLSRSRDQSHTLSLCDKVFVYITKSQRAVIFTWFTWLTRSFANVSGISVIFYSILGTWIQQTVAVWERWEKFWERREKWVIEKFIIDIEIEWKFNKGKKRKV